MLRGRGGRRRDQRFQKRKNYSPKIAFDDCSEFKFDVCRGSGEEDKQGKEF